MIVLKDKTKCLYPFIYASVLLSITAIIDYIRGQIFENLIANKGRLSWCEKRKIGREVDESMYGGTPSTKHSYLG